MEPVKEGKDYHFPAEEEAVLALWGELDAFGEQLRRSEGRPEYVFFDGPPFATGLPHYGHLLAGTIKVRARAAGGRGRAARARSTRASTCLGTCKTPRRPTDFIIKFIIIYFNLLYH